MIQAITFDFDGTLIDIDVMTFISGLVNKEKKTSNCTRIFYQGAKKALLLWWKGLTSLRE